MDLRREGGNRCWGHAVVIPLIYVAVYIRKKADVSAFLLSDRSSGNPRIIAFLVLAV